MRSMRLHINTLRNLVPQPRQENILSLPSRQVPGVLGTFESLEDERVSSGEMYTRPDVLTYKKKKYPVPEVLPGGNHKEIEKWREGTAK